MHMQCQPSVSQFEAWGLCSQGLSMLIWECGGLSAGQCPVQPGLFVCSAAIHGMCTLVVFSSWRAGLRAGYWQLWALCQGLMASV